MLAPNEIPTTASFGYLGRDAKELTEAYEKLRNNYILLRSAVISKNAYITDLEESNSKIKEESDKIRAKYYSGRDLDTYEQWSKEMGRELEAYIEAMAAAYYMKTDLPPDKVVLQTTIDDEGKSIYYWLKPHDESVPKAIEGHKVKM